MVKVKFPKKAKPFHVVGRCMVIVTTKERNLIARLLRDSGREALAKYVAGARRV